MHPSHRNPWCLLKSGSQCRESIPCVVTVTGTTTSGKPLSQENLDKALEACEMAFKLDEDKHKMLRLSTQSSWKSIPQILQFVESRMASIAPNLSLIVGSEIAAKLMGLAGGLHALSRMPACNVLVRNTSLYLRACGVAGGLSP
eukprot:1136170-Pelagomonas_calceolata.AAC.6